MKLGMTGSREGFTIKAYASLRKFCKDKEITEVHHGDCIGSDKMFHNYCEKNLNAKIIIHPTFDIYPRAHCKGDEIRNEKEPLARNRDIVNETDCLIGFPLKEKEIKRSGTWSTIRYTWKRKPAHIIYPDGSIKSFEIGYRPGHV
jgi:hypothetical protein